MAAASRTSFRVAWKTESTLESSCDFGPVDGSAIFNAMGAPGVQYLSGYGFHHSVLLTGIPIGGGSWFYRCGDGTADNTSGAVAFKSAPGPSEDVKISIFGDWGYLDSAQRPMDIPVGGLAKNWSGTLSRELLEGLTAAGEGEVSAVWIVGDQSYADDSFGHTGETLHFGYEECYDGWMEWQFNYSSVMPLMVTAGNHESECHSPYCVTHISTGRALENFTAYNARFAMPSPESGGALNMWYSYDWGPVHVTVINTETDFSGAGEEHTGDSHIPYLKAGGFGAEGEYLSWVEADLRAAAANPDVAWVVAGGHRPMEDLPEAHRNQLLGLFKEHGVAFYFAGHGHTYNRADNASWDDGSTVHIMVGGAGNDETPFPADQFAPTLEGLREFGKTPHEACTEWCTSGPIQEVNRGKRDPCRHCGEAPGYEAGEAPSGFTSAFATDKLSIGVLAASEIELTWQLLRAPDGLVLDSVTVTK